MNKEMMTKLVGKIIKVDRNGPESRSGKLLEVFDDGFVILTEKDGVMYYAMDHVKSITESLKDLIEFALVVPEDFEYKKADTFINLLDSVKFQWVQINRGPEKIEGVLTDVNNDYVSIINKDEVVRLAMFHIRNISYGLKLEAPAKEEEEGSKSQGKNDKR